MDATPFQMPRVLAWEVTRRCPMRCRHCRAGAADAPFADELSTEECFRVVDSLAAGGKGPMVIWTGGEPMTRPDLVELVRRATAKGLRSAIAPCGLLATPARLRELKEAGAMAASFSLDGADAARHDAFRGVSGAFDAVARAMAAAREAGLPFQANVTLSKLNAADFEAIYEMAIARGATRVDAFFLVPVGRGRALDDAVLSDAEVAAFLARTEARRAAGKIKCTCCPQAGTCIGGRGFAFLSHVGRLQTCGFVETPCGNVRDFGCDFRALVAAAENPLGACGNCRADRPPAIGLQTKTGGEGHGAN